MSFRVGTPNYGLPQTEGTDKRDWSDTNQPFLIIDTAIKNAVDTSAIASAAAATAQQTADGATTAAAHAQTDATTAQTLATSASELATLAKNTADAALPKTDITVIKVTVTTDAAGTATITNQEFVDKELLGVCSDDAYLVPYRHANNAITVLARDWTWTAKASTEIAVTIVLLG